MRSVLPKGRYNKYLIMAGQVKISRAIRFYQKNGFVTFANYPFTLGQDVQNDVLMKRELAHSEITNHFQGK